MYDYVPVFLDIITCSNFWISLMDVSFLVMEDIFRNDGHDREEVAENSDFHVKTSSYIYSTGAQEWNIVSLLGDVTSPPTCAHYVSMASALRVLSTEKP